MDPSRRSGNLVTEAWFVEKTTFGAWGVLGLLTGGQDKITWLRR